MTSKSVELKVPPPLLFMITALIMWISAQVYPRFSVDWSFLPVLASLCFTASCFIGATASISFARARTTLNPASPERTSRLITNGIYRLSRNPMYLALAGLLLSLALALANILALLLIIPFVLYLNRFQIRPEEAVLQRLFGNDFADYKRRVGRWLL